MNKTMAIGLLCVSLGEVGFSVLHLKYPAEHFAAGLLLGLGVAMLFGGLYKMKRA
jgi:putative Mn2+ efflux pump MntP